MWMWGFCGVPSCTQKSGFGGTPIPITITPPVNSVGTSISTL